MSADKFMIQGEIDILYGIIEEEFIDIKDFCRRLLKVMNDQNHKGREVLFYKKT